ncbi:enoyl-CoA hydratase-related protein [Thalassobius sp. Cn5-15]|uniref:enoyl-CoA hydratase-related protein n=1 Tax=Thalassobius sp. Cn5-15 TaxID=2917763 RepID=UPI001EF357B1|nr:enoyl-CoA hydratase-related protein [Thalassobius sp. Cn5-15]MCG7495213.1 enoyl-CoA hydratase-related protein [Thalassobius sp. Cn5-15]
MTYQTIETEVRGRVGLIRFNRPDQLNALNTTVMQEVLAAASTFAADTAIGCLILTGAGRAFAAGADIAELSAQTYVSMTESAFFADWDRFAALPIPKVAAINGFALGGGCEVAMMCDVLLASEKAKFGQPEVKIGCIPGIGGTQRLTRLVGRAMAMDLILTGRMIDAQEAKEIGLISRVLAPEDLMDTAWEVAQTIASYPADIVEMGRKCVNAAEQTTLEMGVRMERQMYHALYGLPAQIEGMAAFLEKRAPVFNSPTTQGS